MVDLATDACFVVHARGLSVDGIAYLTFLDELAGAPTYRLTNTVRTECVRHEAGDWVADLEAEGRLAAARNAYTEARREQAWLREIYRGKTPGVHDVGLLRLSREQQLPLLTDDHALYHVALHEGLPVLDIFDVLLAGIGAGRLNESDVADALNFLADPKPPHYQPTGWRELQQTEGLSWPDGCAALAARRRSPKELIALIRPESYGPH